MIGPLSIREIENLLHTQVVGRIGCQDEGEVYIVPIGYAYDGEYIYCHTTEGKKIDIMRRNPRVCFQVEEVKDITNWKSVIAWGEFKELNDPEERTRALHVILNSHMAVISSIKQHLGTGWPFSSKNSGELTKVTGILFRICPNKKTGKFESASESPSLA